MTTAHLPTSIARARIVAGAAREPAPTKAGVPALIAAVGERAHSRFLEFFAARIRNQQRIHIKNY
jgi:hypothetical protein